MKKSLILVLILSLICITNVLLVGQGKELVDYFNLIFLNIDCFNQYHLQEINFQYIISFTLLTNYIIYFLTSEINESITFLSLMMYRCSISRVFNMLQKSECKKILITMLSIILVIFATYIVQNKTLLIFCRDFLSIILYLIKYSLIIIIFTMFYNLMSIFGKHSKALILINGVSIFLILLDLFLKIKLITFSSNVIVELRNLSFLVIITILMYMYIKYKFKKRSDIL